MPKMLLVGVSGVAVLVALAFTALWLDPDAALAKPTASATINPPEIRAGAVYDARFANLDGSSSTLAQWEKKLLVINFWATWCGPCKEEMPLLNTLHMRFKDRGVQFIGIAADSQLNVANFAKKINIGYPLLISESDAIAFSKRLGNRFGLLPHTVMVRPGGEVVYMKLGIVSELEISEIIEKNISKVVK